MQNNDIQIFSAHRCNHTVFMHYFHKNGDIPVLNGKFKVFTPHGTQWLEGEFVDGDPVNIWVINGVSCWEFDEPKQRNKVIRWYDYLGFLYLIICFGAFFMQHYINLMERL